MMTFEEWWTANKDNMESEYFFVKKAFEDAMQSAKEHYEKEFIAVDNYYQDKMRKTAGVEDMPEFDESNGGKLT